MTRRKFQDGRSFTVVETDPGGRVTIEGYDGELLVHRTTYHPATADDIAAAIACAAIACAAIEAWEIRS